ncbi:hypothetical protein V1478_011984 [Vespula squamosa]|uniref:Uncharacterized protein n=1 Tax=Vespula squamosa TaxID=30214 RepID=A0ABD2ABW8_VESSQ
MHEIEEEKRNFVAGHSLSLFVFTLFFLPRRQSTNGKNSGRIRLSLGLLGNFRCAGGPTERRTEFARTVNSKGGRGPAMVIYNNCVTVDICPLEEISRRTMADVKFHRKLSKLVAPGTRLNGEEKDELFAFFPYSNHFPDPWPFLYSLVPNELPLRPTICLSHLPAIKDKKGTLSVSASSPDPRQCPYLGKFTVTGVNHNQRNTRESRRNQHQESLTSRHEGEKVRHAQERIVEDRRGRSKIDFELEKRRANNEYLVRERMGRRARSNRNNRSHRDQQESSSSSRLVSEPQELVHREHGSRLKAKKREKISDELDNDEDGDDGSSRSKRNSKMADFLEDFTEFAHMKQFWMPNFDEVGTSAILEVDDDEYFGDYPDTKKAPKKRSSQGVRSYKSMSFADLTRMRRDLENLVHEEEVTSETREKREEVESRCNAEITTLTVGCSTADRMEFQSDCVDEDAVTAYSCHGRWIDAEGTQFVIATPLARRTTWSNDNNRPQPYRNTQRLCFMYKESGGVVSLTASPVACQRGIPPPAPMLAFNATSTEGSESIDSRCRRSVYGGEQRADASSDVPDDTLADGGGRDI